MSAISSTHPALVQRSRPRWRRRVMLLLLLLAAVGLTRFVYLRITLQPTPRPAYWEAQIAALDPPAPGAVSVDHAMNLITGPPLDDFPEFTDRRQLIALQLGSWNVFRTDVRMANRLFATPAFKEWRDEVLQVLKAGWQEPPVLRQQIAAQSRSYYDLHYWLSAHARSCLTAPDRQHEAVEDWLGAVRLARQVGRGSVAFPIWIERVILNGAGREIICVANEKRLRLDTAALAVSVEAILGPVRSPEQLCAGVRMAAINELEHMFVREGGDWMDVSAMVKYRYDSLTIWNGLTTPAPPRWWNLASPLFHDLPTALDRVEASVARVKTCRNLVECAGLRAEWAATSEHRLTLLDGFSAGEADWFPDSPDFIEMIAAYYQARSMLDAGITVLAITAYRQEHGENPETLDALIPTFLPRVPIDCSDGQPMRYKRKDDGSYVLYGLGSDGTDNNAVYSSNWIARSEQDFPGIDLVYSALRRPENK